jgi:hypothetical protein
VSRCDLLVKDVRLLQEGRATSVFFSNFYLLYLKMEAESGFRNVAIL